MLPKKKKNQKNPSVTKGGGSIDSRQWTMRKTNRKTTEYYKNEDSHDTMWNRELRKKGTTIRDVRKGRAQNTPGKTATESRDIHTERHDGLALLRMLNDRQGKSKEPRDNLWISHIQPFQNAECWHSIRSGSKFYFYTGKRMNTENKYFLNRLKI